ncbi:hypothetical protein [cf. Phormidesmis sp. LEGE 11477]|uniref:hypothetical protein n=1 Tax=cf. Phormidesmis sp. LEGE 11477 TaxID=1828680 RepID=UPI00187EDE87|nr:hypothetical protein [cf. Phormidesmis sp. LEGE 11477]MBE9064041.1 hypothetical protein [cf. Phormidesmis sp. LEGE 11477]
MFKFRRIAAVTLTSALMLLGVRPGVAAVRLAEVPGAIYEISCDLNISDITVWVKMYPTSGTMNRAVGEITMGNRDLPGLSVSFPTSRDIGPGATPAIGAISIGGGRSFPVASASGYFYGITEDGTPATYRIPEEIEVICDSIRDQAPGS